MAGGDNLLKTLTNRPLFRFHNPVASMKHDNYPTEWSEVKNTLKNPYTQKQVKDVNGSKTNVIL